MEKRTKFLFLLSFLFMAVQVVSPTPESLALNFISGGNKDIKDLRFAFLDRTQAARQQEIVNRQKEIEELRAYRDDFVLRAKSAQETALQRIEILRQKMALINEHSAVDSDIVALFAEREKEALDLMEKYDAVRKLLDDLEALLKRYLSTLNTDLSSNEEEERRSSCSWLQFKEAKKKLTQEREKLSFVKEKRAIAMREGMRTRDQAVLHAKQLEQDLTELESRRVTAETSNQKEHLSTLMSLQKALMEEAAQTFRLSEELQVHKENLYSTEYALQKYIVMQWEQRVPDLQDRMIFEQTDIALAEQELKNQKTESAEEYGFLARDFRRIRNEKEAVIKRKQSLDALKVKSDASTAENEKIEQELRLLHQRELYLVHRNRLLEEKVEQKNLQLFIVTLMHERAHDYSGDVVPQKIQGWFNHINQIRKQVEANLERLRDYNQEGLLQAEEHRKYSDIVAAKIDSKLSSQAHYAYQGLLEVVRHMRVLDQEIISLNTQHIELCTSMKGDADFIFEELTREQRAINIWQRSRRAVSYVQLKQAWAEMRGFASAFYQKTQLLLSPSSLWRSLSEQPWTNYPLAFYFFLLLFLFVFGFHYVTTSVGRYVDRLLYIYQGKVWAIYLTIFRSITRFIERYATLIAVWLCVRLHLATECGYYLFAGLSPFYGPYFVSLFYLSSIPLFLYLSYHFMKEVKTINQRMSFLFFTEALQEKFLFLLSSVLYVSALLLPLRQVFLCSVVVDVFGKTGSPLPNVIYGAWTLALSIVFLFFFNKQDVLLLVPSHGRLGQIITGIIDRYYYPVFIFVMGLFILINPYVGYSNFAMYLAACVPLTVLVIYSLLRLHSWIRQKSITLFMKEDDGGDEETADRFEHAKMYYGVFIFLTFLAACLGGFLATTYIWGIDYTVAQLWRGLAHDWVLTIEGTGVHIGFGGLLTLALFVVSGFIISSVFNRFVLGKLFDIFRVEAGAQNTVTRILHYIIIFLSIVLGLHAIKLGQLGNWVLFVLAVGISFGARGLVADFFSGLWLLIERPMEPGNYIESGSLKGTVKKIALRATTIRTATNHSVIVPNSQLVSQPIINWGGGYYAVGFEFSITISYHADPQMVRDLIAQVVTGNSQVLRIPPVLVRLENFGQSGLEYTIRAFISSRRVREQWDIAALIRIEIMKALRENNIGIPYPHVVITQTNAFGVSKGVAEDDGPETKI